MSPIWLGRQVYGSPEPHAAYEAAWKARRQHARCPSASTLPEHVCHRWLERVQRWRAVLRGKHPPRPPSFVIHSAVAIEMWHVLKIFFFALPLFGSSMEKGKHNVSRSFFP